MRNLLSTSLIFASLIFAGLLFASLPAASGQKLAAFHDNQGHFYVFDDGIKTQVEYLPVKSFRVGGDCLLYADNQNRLKMYYNGEVTMLERSAAGQYQALDYLSFYAYAGMVKVIERGEVALLGSQIASFFAEDSLVVFYDRGQEWLAAYYRGKAMVLEDGLSGRSFEGLAAGDNLVAWVSAISGNLNVFYRGSTTVAEPYFTGNSYKAGRDILAFVSASDQKFRVFYKGEVMVISEFPPVSYETGDGTVAYIDHMGRFNVFSNGMVQEISSFGPDSYHLQNGLILFEEQGFFKVWHKDRMYVLENHVPAEWKASWNTVVYRDINGNLKAFRNGESSILTYDIAEQVELYRDIIAVNRGMNNWKIYYKDGEY